MDYELIKRILNKPGIIEEGDLIVLKKAAKYLKDIVELHSAVSLKREICANLAEEAGLRDIKFFWDDTNSTNDTNCHQLTRRCPTVEDMEKLYDVLISHFKKESKPLDLFNDSTRLVSTKYIIDKHDVFHLVRVKSLNSVFLIPYSMHNPLASMGLAPGDKIYISHISYVDPLKVTVISSNIDSVNVKRDA